MPSLPTPGRTRAGDPCTSLQTSANSEAIWPSPAAGLLRFVLPLRDIHKKNRTGGVSPRLSPILSSFPVGRKTAGGLYCGFKFFFSHAAEWTHPVFRQVFKGGTRRDAAVFVAFCRIVYISANDTSVFFHLSFFLMIKRSKLVILSDPAIFPSSSVGRDGDVASQRRKGGAIATRRDAPLPSLR